MAEKRVSELNSASSINLSDLLLLTQDLGQGEYDSLNVSASLLATWLASQVQFPLLLTETTAKDIIGAINEIASNGGGGAVFLHTQLGTTTIDEDADDIYDAYTNEKLLCLSVLANGQYLLFACTKQTDYTIGDGVTLEFEGEVEGYKWLYEIHVDATNDTVTLERTTTELPTIEDIQELHDEIVSMLPTESASGAVASFETPLTLPLVSHNVTIEPVQAGTGDPSPSNVRPISGWNAMNVTRTGKNLAVANDFASGIFVYSSNGKVKVNGTISATAYVPTASQAVSNNLCFTLKAGTYIPSVVGTLPTGAFVNVVSESNVSLSQGASFTLDKETKVFYRIVLPAGTYDFETSVQIELGTTATDYEPYTGESVEIPLGQTVYGGELDVTNGVLRVTTVLFTVNGSDKVEYMASNLFRVNKSKYPDGLFTSDNINGLMCSKFKPQISSTPTDTCYNTVNGLIIRPITGYSSATAFYEGIGEFTFSYLLATPVEVTLTPEQINTLKGVNNIWADTGDTAVEYKQDIQTYIDNRLSSGTRSLSLAKAPVETKAETKQEEQEEKEETKTEEEVENDAER